MRLSAAASFGPVLETLKPAIEADLGLTLQLNLAGSGTLARQIIDGAPADAVVLAHPDWMGSLVDADLVESKRVTTLAENRLIGVGAENTSVSGLPDLLTPTVGRVAVADPASVPAGRYAEQALAAAGLWEALQPKLVTTGNVRAAYAYATLGLADVAIVYATDISPDDAVVVLFEVDSALHDVVRVVGAEVNGSAQGQRLMDWLRSAQARRAYRQARFTLPVTE